MQTPAVLVNRTRLHLCRSVEEQDQDVSRQVAGQPEVLSDGNLSGIRPTWSGSGTGLFWLSAHADHGPPPDQCDVSDDSEIGSVRAGRCRARDRPFEAAHPVIDTARPTTVPDSFTSPALKAAVVSPGIARIPLSRPIGRRAGRHSPAVPDDDAGVGDGMGLSRRQTGRVEKWEERDRAAGLPEKAAPGVCRDPRRRGCRPPIPDRRRRRRSCGRWIDVGAVRRAVTRPSRCRGQLASLVTRSFHGHFRMQISLLSLLAAKAQVATSFSATHILLISRKVPSSET